MANHQNTVTYGSVTLVKKSKGVSLILCLLGSGFGLHKFYEGNYIMGILYILTGGFWYVGTIVDLIVLIRKPNPYYVPSPKDQNLVRLIRNLIAWLVSLAGKPLPTKPIEAPKEELPKVSAPKENNRIALESGGNNTALEVIDTTPAEELPVPVPAAEPDMPNEAIQNAEADMPVRKLPRNVKAMPELITGPQDRFYRLSSLSGNTASYYCPITGHMVTITNKDIGPNGTSAEVNGDHFYW